MHHPQDFAVPLMTDARFDDDTVFLIAEEDWRLTPEAAAPAAALMATSDAAPATRAGTGELTATAPPAAAAASDSAAGESANRPVLNWETKEPGDPAPIAIPTGRVELSADKPDPGALCLTYCAALAYRWPPSLPARHSAHSLWNASPPCDTTPVCWHSRRSIG